MIILRIMMLVRLKYQVKLLGNRMLIKQMIMKELRKNTTIIMNLNMFRDKFIIKDNNIKLNPKMWTSSNKLMNIINNNKKNQSNPNTKNKLLFTKNSLNKFYIVQDKNKSFMNNLNIKNNNKSFLNNNNLPILFNNNKNLTLLTFTTLININVNKRNDNNVNNNIINKDKSKNPLNLWLITLKINLWNRRQNYSPKS